MSLPLVTQNSCDILSLPLVTQNSRDILGYVFAGVIINHNKNEEFIFRGFHDEMINCALQQYIE